MRLKQVANMEQVQNLQVGDIIPIFNKWSFMGGKLTALVEDREEETIVLFTKYEGSNEYRRVLISDINKGNVDKGRYSIFCLKPVEMKEKFNPEDVDQWDEFEKEIYWEHVDKNDPAITKFEEAIK